MSISKISDGPCPEIQGAISLTREGKEKLATDILAEVSAPLGYGANAKRRERDDDAEEDSPRRARKSPVRRVLFSSFIIQ